MRRPFHLDDSPPDDDDHQNQTEKEMLATVLSRSGTTPGAVRARLRALRAHQTARRIGSVGGGLLVTGGVVIAGFNAGTPHTIPAAGHDLAEPRPHLPPASLPKPVSPPVASPPGPTSRPAAPPPPTPPPLSLPRSDMTTMPRHHPARPVVAAPHPPHSTPTRCGQAASAAPDGCPRGRGGNPPDHCSSVRPRGA
jgi:hypothetical protein